SDDNPRVAMVANAIEAFDPVTAADLGEPLRSDADAAHRIAKADLSTLPENEDRERSAKTIVAGTVLGDTIIAGLRRIAQEHHSKVRLAGRDTATSHDDDSV